MKALVLLETHANQSFHDWLRRQRRPSESVVAWETIQATKLERHPSARPNLRQIHLNLVDPTGGYQGVTGHRFVVHIGYGEGE